jgi:hypothetical protein
MKTKHIIALKGTANVGKSTTIRKVFALLKEAYPTAHIQIINPPGIEITVTIKIDITVIIGIDGTSVGIESCGDPPPNHTRLIESIEQFKKTKCSIIVCATRTSGVSVNTVENNQNSRSLGIPRNRNQKTCASSVTMRWQRKSSTKFRLH